MSTHKPKAAAPKVAPAVVVPDAPVPAVIDESQFTPFAPEVTSTATEPHVFVDRPTLRSALERIANGRLCGCSGDHDDQVNDCPKTIARRALE